MAKDELIIEEAQVTDALLVLQFLQDVCQETDLILKSPDLLDMSDIEHFLLSNLNRLNAICLVAKWNNQLIGMVNVVGKQDPYTEHVGDLFIAVKAGFQRQGLGRDLMTLVCEWAEDSPLIKRLELTVQARNKPAIQLYRAFGFTQEGIQRSAVKLADDSYIDIVMMSKLIGNN